MSMNNRRIVSVLVPVFNVEEYLGECIDSILLQSYDCIQVILVDDGSTDGSWEICQEYVSKDRRVEAYHQSNLGVAATRNHLLDKIRGDYFLFIDSDDWIEPNMLEYLVDLLEKEGAGISMCDKVINGVTPFNTEPSVFCIDRERAVFDFLQHGYFKGMLWNKLIRSSLLSNNRFITDISYGEDALFCWELLKKVDIVAVSNKQLYHYRMNPNSISHCFGERKFSAYEVWNKITDDTSAFFPNLLAYAQAHYCVSMTMVLYDAAKNGYEYNDRIVKILGVIKKYKIKMLFYSKRSIKKFILALMLSISYSFTRLLLFRKEI